MIVPVSVFVQLDLPDSPHHGLEVGVLTTIHRARGICPLLCSPRLDHVGHLVGFEAWYEALRNCDIDRGVIEVEVGYDHVQQTLGAVYSAFQALDVLWRRVPSSIRGLVIRAIYSLSVWKYNVAVLWRHTITVDGTMRAWLLAVTFDLLAAALVTGSGNATSLLSRHRRLALRLCSGIGPRRRGRFRAWFLLVDLFPGVLAHVVVHIRRLRLHGSYGLVFAIDVVKDCCR